MRLIFHVLILAAMVASLPLSSCFVLPPSLAFRSKVVVFAGQQQAAEDIQQQQQQQEAEECGLTLETACGPSTDPSKSKANGFGYAPKDLGYKGLFDPEEEAKLQSTGDLDERIQRGADFVCADAVNRYYYGGSGDSAPGAEVHVERCQDFLEEGFQAPPTNTFKASDPAVASVLGVGKLIGPNAPGDIRHVVLKLPPSFNYVEGQSISVLPPGTDVRGKPHRPRLYSIASTRYGDTLDGTTVSLCVRRAVYTDEASGKEDPSKKGVCSNFLCDLEPGSEVKVAGPVGKSMCLPPNLTSDSVDIIMVGTGTGVAPFRSFCHRMFTENTVVKHMYNGNASLYLGVPTSDGVLYKAEFDYMEATSGGRFKANYAVSREMKNEDGTKTYVQDLLKRDGEKIFNTIDAGGQIYFCGLKGMMPGITSAFESIAGDGWDSKLKEWRDRGLWHVEVY